MIDAFRNVVRYLAGEAHADVNQATTDNESSALIIAAQEETWMCFVILLAKLMLI